MAEHLQGIVYVYNKEMELLAMFGEQSQGLSGSQVLEGIGQEAMRNLMVSPTVHIEQNGESTLSFQMIASSEKWQTIKDPNNIYYVNGRYYTPLTDEAYVYSGEDTARIVTVKLVEIWYMLRHNYNQVYNCGIYCYAKAHFQGWTTDGAIFTINASDCSNPGDTISSANAWEQVKTWQRLGDLDNILSYAILTDDKHKPYNWEDVPSAVAIKSFTVSGNTATMTIESRVKALVQQTFDYEENKTYKLLDQQGNDMKPVPAKLNKVFLNITTVTESGAAVTYKTETIDVSYNYSNGSFTLNYNKPDNVNVNGVIAEYDYNNLGKIKDGATCTFAYGAEVVDEHTFIILPKAKIQYKLTINGKQYNDSEIKDSRGAIMPRGSAGYAMWAALKDSSWALGICDVLAKDFDPSIDYGCFNVENDMKDTLTIIQEIQSLYGGILDWDSENLVLNYRAENNEDYQAYQDGFNDWKGYVFRQGKNMTDPPVITHDNDVITKAYVLGYGNLNIKAVNNGKPYIENYSFTDNVLEGYLTQNLIYDTNDEGGQRQLLYWGQKELAKQCKPRVSIEISATDVRTVEGLEHEVFDIHDIVKVYYFDSQDNTEKIIEQRIVMWEYDVFAMWDCSVETGDKTNNAVEIFKLIYKKSLNTPNANGSGQISSNQVSFKPWGSSNDGSNGTIDKNTLAGELQFIAQTTTDNSDAIAGLLVNTNNLYAQVQLFAQYQKQTDTLFNETYAGLQFYADEKSAAAEVAARNYTKEQVTLLDGSVGERITQSQAALMVYADNKVASVETSVALLQREQDKLYDSQSTFRQEVTQNYAQISLLASYTLRDSDGNTFTLAGLDTYVDSQVAQNSLIASFTRNGINSYAGLEQFVSEEISSNEVISEFSDRYGNFSTSKFGTLVNEEIAAAGIYATKGEAEAYVYAVADVYGGEVHLGGTNTSVYIDGGKEFHYYNVQVGWTDFTVHTESGRTVRLKLLGEIDQGSIYSVSDVKWQG